MAKKPTAESPSPFKALGEEAEARLAAAREQKDRVALDLKEGYFFTRPRLARTLRSDSNPKPSSPGDEDELVTGVGTEVAEDFATEVLNGFFPPHAQWVRSIRAGGVPEEIWQKVEARAKENDKRVFDLIAASNFYAELATAVVPDIALGTLGLWIDQTEISEPVRVQHVPLRELEINIGPYGDVDDRFAVRHVRARDLAATVPVDRLPADIRRSMSNEGGKWTRVAWGFWRDWKAPRQHRWTRVLMVDNQVIEGGELEGDGAVPLIVSRFSPDSLNAFGNGPTIDALPMLRVLDVLTEAQQNRASTAMNPPFAYDDDGVLNFEGGVEDGKGYPKRPGGGRDAIVPLYFEGQFDFGMFTVADIERAVRRKHFADYPEQPGKTPPTATQWIDEMVKSQRRIGTPGQRFWKEGPAQIFRRFQYIAEKRGIIEPLMLDKATVATEPSNPATKAQDQQEVQTAIRVLELTFSFFPQVATAAIDAIATIDNIKKKLGDELVKLNDPEKVQAVIDQIAAQAPDLINQNRNVGVAPPNG